MKRNPLSKGKIVIEDTVLRGPMTDLANEADRQLIAAVARDGEPYRIGGSLLGKARAGGRISQIAELLYFFGAGFGAFVAGSGTLTGPTGAQRKTRRMRPQTVFQPRGRHEEWASHRQILFLNAAIVLRGEPSR